MNYWYLCWMKNEMVAVTCSINKNFFVYIIITINSYHFCWLKGLEMIQDHGHPHTVEVKVHIFLPSTETKRWLYNSIMLNLTNMMVIPAVCRGLKGKRDGMNKAITWHSVKMLNSNIPIPQRKLIRNSVILTGTPIYTSQNTAPLPTPGQII